MKEVVSRALKLSHCKVYVIDGSHLLKVVVSRPLKLSHDGVEGIEWIHWSSLGH